MNEYNKKNKAELIDLLAVRDAELATCRSLLKESRQDTRRAERSVEFLTDELHDAKGLAKFWKNAAVGLAVGFTVLSLLAHAA